MRFYMQGDGTGIVAAEGDLSTYNATDLGKALSEALESSDRVTLDFQNVNTIDLSCLQLVYSAFLTSQDMKKAMNFGESLPKSVEMAAKEAGYPEISAIGDQIRGKGSGPRTKASGGGKKTAGKRKASVGRRKAKKKK